MCIESFYVAIYSIGSLYMNNCVVRYIRQFVLLTICLSLSLESACAPRHVFSCDLSTSYMCICMMMPNGGGGVGLLRRRLLLLLMPLVLLHAGKWPMTIVEQISMSIDFRQIWSLLIWEFGICDVLCFRLSLLIPFHFHLAVIVFVRRSE